MKNDTLFHRFLELTIGEGTPLTVEDLHVVINMQTTDTTKPYIASIKIYNLAYENYLKIQKGTAIKIDAGYKDNHSVIFDGKVHASRYGRINTVDTFTDIRCIAGAEFTKEFLNTTIKKDSKFTDVAEFVGKSTTYEMNNNVKTISETRLIKSKTILNYPGLELSYFSKANNVFFIYRASSKTIDFVDLQSSFTLSPIILTPKTGLIGRPEITLEGIKGRSLLNKDITIGSTLKIEKDLIDDYYDKATYAQMVKAKPAYDVNNLYFVYQMSYSLDTRGQDWYVDFLCIDTKNVRAVFGKQFALIDGGVN